MKNAVKWSTLFGVSSVMLMGLAGCGGNDGDAAGGNAAGDGVPNSIESPVMDKSDDKAVAGSDNSEGNAATGNAATGNAAIGNTASGNTASGNAAGDGVPNNIESPVMDKSDDKAMAGGDNSNNSASGSTSGGGSTKTGS
jgi:hypothetical protein